jgi:hypothetical protein
VTIAAQTLDEVGLVRGDEVVAVPGLAEARGYEGAVTGEQE